MVVNFATGTKVSAKSIPGFWRYPLATSRALYRPSSFFRINQRQPIAVLSAGSGSKRQVLFFAKEVSSDSNASRHFSFSLLVSASVNVSGSSVSPFAISA